jgi:hypothetical protein
MEPAAIDSHVTVAPASLERIEQFDTLSSYRDIYCPSLPVPTAILHQFSFRFCSLIFLASSNTSGSTRRRARLSHGMGRLWQKWEHEEDDILEEAQQQQLPTSEIVQIAREKIRSRGKNRTLRSVRAHRWRMRRKDSTLAGQTGPQRQPSPEQMDTSLQEGCAGSTVNNSPFSPSCKGPLASPPDAETTCPRQTVYPSVFWPPAYALPQLNSFSCSEGQNWMSISAQDTFTGPVQCGPSDDQMLQTSYMGIGPCLGTSILLDHGLETDVAGATENLNLDGNVFDCCDVFSKQNYPASLYHSRPVADCSFQT